ncbi:MAG: CPBP family intramembrane glutamic endopeptidase [Phycisphaerales bacterium]
MTTPYDTAIAVILVVVLPLAARRQFRTLLGRIAADGAAARHRAYRRTIVRQWLLVALVVLAWTLAHRDIVTLGLALPRGWGFTAGSLLTGGLLVVLALQRRAIAGRPELREAVRAKLRNVQPILPHGDDEVRRFARVALTAGICEEFLYRGFLTWYLAQHLPIGAAIVASAVAFGLGHSYQGLRGVAQTGALGLAMGLLCALSGSLWLAMIAHAAIDLNAGRVAVLAFGPDALSRSSPASPPSSVPSDER